MLLGSGTYGEIYQDKSDPNIALKTILFENLPSAVSEIMVLKRLNHPNIIQVKKVVTHLNENNIKLYLECYDRDLDDFVTEVAPLRPKLIENFAQQIFSGLFYLHSQNIIHRDLTPGNILLKKTGKRRRDGIPQYHLAICDFGLSLYRLSPRQTKFNTTVCTVNYRAPEVYTGVGCLRYDEKIDVWSFGCILYFLIAGEDMMTWDEYSNYFKYTSLESSRYLCKFFNLPDFNNHLTRIKALKQLSRAYLKSRYQSSLKSLRKNSKLINKYINIITDCLMPYPCERTTLLDLKTNPIFNQESLTHSKSSLQRLEDNFFQMKLSQIKLSSFIHTCEKTKISKKTMTKAFDVDHDSLLYAAYQSIYNQFIDQCPQKTMGIFRLGVLYIASLLIEIDDDRYDEILFNEIGPSKMVFIILYILKKLNWKIDSF